MIKELINKTLIRQGKKINKDTYYKILLSADQIRTRINNYEGDGLEYNVYLSDNNKVLCLELCRDVFVLFDNNEYSSILKTCDEIDIMAKDDKNEEEEQVVIVLKYKNIWENTDE